MEKKRNLLKACIACLLGLGTLAGCNIFDTPEFPDIEGGEKKPDEHVCAHKCSICQKCMDFDCTDPACAEKCEGHNTNPDQPTVFSSIVISEKNVTISFGGTKQLSATVTANKSTYTEKISWSSSNTGVCTVDSTGKVSAVAAGSAVITASIGSTAGSVSDTANITVEAKKASYLFAGLNLKPSFTTSASNKGEQTNKEEEFYQKNKDYYVGTENAFSVLPEMSILDIDSRTSYTNSTGSIEKWDKDFKYEISKMVDNSPVDTPAADYQIVNNRKGEIKFAESAIGNNYEIKVTAGGLTATQEARASASVTYSVKVIKGYNVYNAKEVSYIDQRTGNDLDMTSWRNGDIIGFKNGWEAFKTANGLNPNYRPDCLIFQDNINVTTSDIPSSFVYTAKELKTANDDKAIGSLKDIMDIYVYYGNKGEGNNQENTLKVYGNYFTIDFSRIPLVKRENGEKSEAGACISHSSFFRSMCGSLQFEDMKIKGNSKRAITEADKVNAGGGIMFKACEDAKKIITNNIITRQCFITYYAEKPSDVNQYVIEFDLDQCKSFDNYNSFVYSWGGVINASNSTFGMCGGPCLIQEQAGYGESSPENFDASTLTYELHGYVPKSRFVDCTFDNYVAGTEAWFVQMGATSLVPQIKALSDLYAAYGMSYATDQNKVPVVVSQQTQGISMFNFIALNKVGGASLQEVMKPASGSIEIVNTKTSKTSYYDYVAPDKAKVDEAKGIMTKLLTLKATQDAQAQGAIIQELIPIAAAHNIAWSDTTTFSDLISGLSDYCTTVGMSECGTHALLRGANGAGAPVFQNGNYLVSYNEVMTGNYGLQDISNVQTWTSQTPNVTPIDATHGFVTSRAETTGLYYAGMLLVMGLNYFQA